jgi:hypothetical protein
MVLKKQDKNSMQSEKLIGPGCFHGEYPSLWCYPLLRWLLARWLFLPCGKKLLHKIISHLFSRVADIRGHKGNISAANKISNTIWCKESIECIKLQKLTKYQNTQKESSWDSNKWSKKKQKTESANKNNSSLANFSAPLKQVTHFCYIFIQVDNEKLPFYK